MMLLASLAQSARLADGPHGTRRGLVRTMHTKRRVTLSPSDAALVADVLDEILEAQEAGERRLTPLHARVEAIRDRLRGKHDRAKERDEHDARSGREADEIPRNTAFQLNARNTPKCEKTVICILDKGHRGPCQGPGGIKVEMRESLDRAAATMSMIDEATGQGRR
jgi:hypothetical protein